LDCDFGLDISEAVHIVQQIFNVEKEKFEYENKRLRYLLWIRHQGKDCYLYGDDGEMQCNACVIDFKRDTPDQIATRFMKINHSDQAKALAFLRKFFKDEKKS